MQKIIICSKLKVGFIWQVWFKSNYNQTYLRICATTAGPYQSPACFPIVRPKRTSLWRPNWAEGLSPNQDTRVRWYISFKCASASSADPGAWAWCMGSKLWSEVPGELCRDASREATRRLAAVVVQVCVSKGWSASASGQVQSVEEQIVYKTSPTIDVRD